MVRCGVFVVKFDVIRRRNVEISCLSGEIRCRNAEIRVDYTEIRGCFHALVVRFRRKHCEETVVLDVLYGV